MKSKDTEVVEPTQYGSCFKEGGDGKKDRLGNKPWSGLAWGSAPPQDKFTHSLWLSRRHLLIISRWWSMLGQLSLKTNCLHWHQLDSLWSSHHAGPGGRGVWKHHEWSLPLFLPPHPLEQKLLESGRGGQEAGKIMVLARCNLTP